MGMNDDGDGDGCCHWQWSSSANGKPRPADIVSKPTSAGYRYSDAYEPEGITQEPEIGDKVSPEEYAGENVRRRDDCWCELLIEGASDGKGTSSDWQCCEGKIESGGGGGGDNGRDKNGPIVNASEKYDCDENDPEVDASGRNGRNKYDPEVNSDSTAGNGRDEDDLEKDASAKDGRDKDDLDVEARASAEKVGDAYPEVDASPWPENGLDEDNPVVDASPENGLDEDNPEVDASHWQGNGFDEDDSDPEVDAPVEEKVWKFDETLEEPDESCSTPRISHTGTHFFLFFLFFFDLGI